MGPRGLKATLCASMINEGQSQLSEREQVILRLVATGLSNQQIANQLGISINTVKVHLRNVFGKIGAASRTEATLYAVRTGLVAVERAHTLLPDAVDTLPPVPVVEAPLAEAPSHREESINDVLVLPNVVAAPDVVDELVVHAQPVVAPPVVPVRQSRRNRWLLVLVPLLLLALVGGVLASGVLRREAPSVSTPTASTASAPLDGGWHALPTLPAPRAAFAAANVGDYVYVMGGENTTGVVADVARYDARDEVWTERSRKPTAVGDVRAARIGDKLYVPGGRTGTDPASVTAVFERYDPRAERWETLQPLPAPRSGYALAALEGKLYLFGGWDGTKHCDDVWVYEPDNDTWRTIGTLPTARAFAEAGVVENNIYVVGGENENGPLAVNEVYNPGQEGAQAWSTGAPMPTPRSRFGLATALFVIYVVGGDMDAPPLQYETSTDRWTPYATSPQPVGQQPGVVMLNTSLVSVGGKQDTTYLNHVQSFQAVFTQSAPFAQ